MATELTNAEKDRGWWYQIGGYRLRRMIEEPYRNGTKLVAQEPLGAVVRTINWEDDSLDPEWTAYDADGRKLQTFATREEAMRYVEATTELQQ